MAFADYMAFCSVCDRECLYDDQSRTLHAANGLLIVDPPGDSRFTALDDERARGCGQHHALILVERYLDRGTFAPADHNATTQDNHQPTAEPALHDDLAPVNITANRNAL